MTRCVLLFLTVVLATPVFAQYRPATKDLVGKDGVLEYALPTIELDRNAVRLLRPGDVPVSIRQPLRSGTPFDTLAYWDTEDDSLFFSPLRSDDGIVEIFQRITPGVGNGPFGSVPPPALPAMAGQATDFRFCIAGPNPVLGDPDDALVFVKQKVETGDDLLIAPPFPFVLVSIPLNELGIGVPGARCFTLDLVGLNFFFEADEEFFGRFFLDERAGSTPNNARVQFLLDDGDGTIVGPDAAQPGYYNPPRSVYFDDLASGYFSFPERNNMIFEEYVEYDTLPTVDVELNAACGFVDTCRFSPGDTLVYTGCLKNNSGSLKEVNITVQAFPPNGVPRTTLFLSTPPVSTGRTFCRAISQPIPANAPRGFYAVQVLVDDADGVDFTYDTDHIFLTVGPPSATASAPPMLRRADLLNVEAQAASPEWTATALGDWGIVEAGAATDGETTAAAFPNPFARETTIQFTTTTVTEARLAIYDVTGREVAVLVNGTIEAGQHNVAFDARGLASGLYVYRLEAGTTVQTGRLTLLR